MGQEREDYQDSIFLLTNIPVFHYSIIPWVTHGMKVAERFL